jgi:hypothetical protein
LVKWIGYDETTWEPAENLQHLDELREFEEKEAQEAHAQEVDADASNEKLDEGFDDGGAVNEPKSYHQAMRSKQKPHWMRAMEKELNSHEKNDTWTFIEPNQLPTGAYVVDSKWVFKLKRNPDQSIKKYKARLVARGFTQRPGLDFDETYAPVVKFTTLRVMLAIACQMDMEIHQMDVVTAFLNSKVDAEIYMKLMMDGEEKLVKLNKSIYGLKQAPRLWNQTIDTFLRTLGFIPSSYDSAFYVRYGAKGQLDAMISLYVDDLTICTHDMEEMLHIKEGLRQRFHMEDMGELSYILGLEVQRDRTKRSLTLSQGKYIDDIIRRFKLDSAPGISTPLDAKKTLFMNELEPRTDAHEYQSMIGSLMYLVMGTRPDLAYAVSKLSQYSINPRVSHREAAIRTLRYAKSTRNLAMTYEGYGDLILTGYSDSDYAKCLETRRSMSGYVFTLHGGAVAWKAQLQRTPALSTAEAEYMALCEASKEAIWLQNFLQSVLQRNETKPTPVIIKEDNKAAIDIANNPVDHQRTKHIDVRYHFTREKVKEGILMLEHCSTHQMLADLLTKPLPKPQTDVLTAKLGLRTGRRESTKKKKGSHDLGGVL